MGAWPPPVWVLFPGPIIRSGHALIYSRLLDEPPILGLLRLDRASTPDVLLIPPSAAGHDPHAIFRDSPEVSYRRLKATASRATHAAARDVTAHRPDPCRPTRAGRGSAWELSRDSPVAKLVSDPTSYSVGNPRDRLGGDNCGTPGRRLVVPALLLGYRGPAPVARSCVDRFDIGGGDPPAASRRQSPRRVLMGQGSRWRIAASTDHRSSYLTGQFERDNVSNATRCTGTNEPGDGLAIGVALVPCRLRPPEPSEAVQKG